MFKSNQIKYMDIIKRTISLFKKYYAEFLILVGAGIFTSNLLDFSHYRVRLSVNPDVSYYYLDTTIRNITIGVIVIVLGILIIRSKRQKHDISH